MKKKTLSNQELLEKMKEIIHQAEILDGSTEEKKQLKQDMCFQSIH